ncbi:FprA family A-type flavoprotein [Parablautia intestinalis]|uniref:FprA family A-type flavoprotein n=1 Tax=Parablautia intestinalis TaxID=2320100 RepID=UPI00256F18DD|nr:FprA family A-type flavoprotein [Parablautia intestinalis]
MNVTKDILYAGVNDHQVDLFEGQYVVPNGMAYNSYVILDEKTAVMDTVDAVFGKQWLENVEKALQGRRPDYLIIQHMEPDHSANIPAFLEKYPEARVAATPAAFRMMNQFFGMETGERAVPVTNGEELSLGEHTLQFIFAPMVHWPEVMLTYDKKDKVLFSADGFGKFGALDVEEEWAGEARRYYFGIVGKYGIQVQNVLKKAAELDIRMICPLHGPVLSDNLGYYLNLYDTWSSYRAEEEGVTIAYGSIYGHTREAALYLAQALEKKGVRTVVHDLARTDLSRAVEDAFHYDRLVLASNTYNAGINPFMNDFISRLLERSYQKRQVALIENGSWGPMAAKTMRGLLEKSKDIVFAKNTVTIMSAMKQEDREKLEALAEELAG